MLYSSTHLLRNYSSYIKNQHTLTNFTLTIRLISDFPTLATMGFDTGLLLDPLNEDLVCALCHDVMQRPTTACNEGHTYCRDCIDNVPSPRRCPMCRSEALPTLMLNRPLQNMIGRLRVQCKHAASSDDEPASNRQRTEDGACARGGCVWTGTLDTLAAHLADDCRFADMLCGNEGCLERMQRNALEAHRLTCPHRLVECEDCKESVKAKSLEKHRSTCPKVTVTCPCCNESMLREKLGTGINLTCFGLFIGGGVREHDPRDLDTPKESRLSGHFLTCPRLPILCAFRKFGCRHVSERKDYAVHHAEAATSHAELVGTEMERLSKEINDTTQWKEMDMRWSIPRVRLAGSGRKVLKSQTTPVAGYDMYLKLVAQEEEVKIYVCAEDPLTTPVQVRCVRIGAPHVESRHDDGGKFEGGFRDIGQDRFTFQGVELEAEPGRDPCFGGELMRDVCGAQIEYDTEYDSDGDVIENEPEYETDKVAVTRAVLMSSATSDEAGHIELQASFYVMKCTCVNVKCR